jgi:hypothetical protein
MVLLDTGETLAVGIDANAWGGPSEIVVVEESIGRFSGEMRFEAKHYVPVADAELFWRSNTRW